MKKALGIGLFLLEASSFAAPAQQYVISTIAGTVLPPLSVSAVNTSIGQPQRVVTDGSGNLYFSSFNAVFKLDGQGNLTVVAGTGRRGSSGDGGPATAAQLNTPQGLALDPTGNLYIADTGNHRIRVVSPFDGTITTVAGTGARGFSGEYGLAVAAQLNLPSGVAVDSGYNVYIADTGNHCIRKVAPDGTISAFAGSFYAGYSGDTGLAISALLSAPQDVALDSSGNLYIADTNNEVIRKVATDGTISTVAGSASATSAGDGGAATSAQLGEPGSVAVDSSGNLYIADSNYYRVRMVDSKGIISTVAGNATFGFSGDGGQATKAQLGWPQGISVDGSGNLYITDPWNFRIRKVASGGAMSTIAGDGFFSYSGDGGLAIKAQLYQPRGIAVDTAGNVYFSEYGNYRIRRISAGGTVVTVAGTGAGGYSGDGGPAASAQIGALTGLAVDRSGSLYIADADNNRVRKVSTDGKITTVAGNGTFGFSGDSGPATNAQLREPLAVAVDGSGNIFISDGASNRVRKVSTDGVITTVAGNGTFGFSGDRGPATSAQLKAPWGLAVDSAGNLYIGDAGNNRIRMVSPAGIITTVAGNGRLGYGGDGGSATDAQIVTPNALALDSDGNLILAGSTAARIRKVSQGYITTIGGNGTFGYSGDGGPAMNAQVNGPSGVAVDSSGNIYLADTGNNAIRLMQLSQPANAASGN